MSDENDKTLGMSPLATAAIQIHEIYEEFKKAGFSRREAMQLTQNMVATMFVQALKED
jgi:hypothetical protein